MDTSYISQKAQSFTSAELDIPNQTTYICKLIYLKDAYSQLLYTGTVKLYLCFMILNTAMQHI
jgi:hypothetical protein